MANYTEELGSPSASATVILVGASSLTAVASNQFRRSVNLYNGGSVPINIGYGQAAVASQGWPVAAGAAWEESDFSGALNIISTGATAAVFVVEVGSGS